jgi:hypothetical protein
MLVLMRILTDGRLRTRVEDEIQAVAQNRLDLVLDSKALAQLKLINGVYAS